LSYGTKIEPMLIDQKPHLVQKLIKDSKKEVLTNPAKTNGTSLQPNKPPPKQSIDHENNLQRASNQIRDSALNQSALNSIIDDS